MSDDLANELLKTDAEADRWFERYCDKSARCQELADKYEALEAENARLRDALAQAQNELTLTYEWLQREAIPGFGGSVLGVQYAAGCARAALEGGDE